MTHGGTELRQALPSLTGLRYLAAALVVVHHSAPVLAFGTTLQRASSVGYVGVSFFFVLSGFVLTWSRREGTSARSFYRRRFARVYPLHLTTWLGAVVVASLIGLDKTAASLILSLLLLQAWVPAENVVGAGNSVSWSLSCEAFFYALFPLLTSRRFGLDQRGKWVIPAAAGMTMLGVVFALSPVYSHWLAYYSPIYRLGEFCVGILLAAAIKQGRWPRLPLWAAVAALAASYLAIGLILQDPRRGLADALMLPSISLLIATAATSDLDGSQTVWAHPVMVRLGQWSFALYLVHYMMVRVLPRFLGGPLHDGLPVGCVLVASFLIAATGVAAAAYYLLEQPAERRLRGDHRTQEQDSPAMAGEPL